MPRWFAIKTPQKQDAQDSPLSTLGRLTQALTGRRWSAVATELLLIVVGIPAVLSIDY